MTRVLVVDDEEAVVDDLLHLVPHAVTDAPHPAQLARAAHWEGEPAHRLGGQVLGEPPAEGHALDAAIAARLLVVGRHPQHVADRLLGLEPVA